MTLAETSAAEEVAWLSAARPCLDTRWSHLDGVRARAVVSEAAG